MAQARDEKDSGPRGSADGSTPDILSLLAADHAEVRTALDEYEDMGEDEDASSGRSLTPRVETCVNT